MAITLARYRAKCAAKFGLDNSGSNPGSLTAEQTLMHEWANEAYSYILAETKCYITGPTALTLSANDTDVSIPSTWLALGSIFAPSSTDASAYRRMQRISADELLEYRLTSTTAAPSTPLYYAVQGTNQLMVYPSPSTSMDLKTYYVPQPTAMSGDSDTASQITPEWQWLVELFMNWQAGEYTNDGPSHNGADFRAQLDAEIIKFREAIRNYGGRVLNPTPLGRRRRPVYLRGQDDGT